MAIDFDGDALVITLDTGVTEIDVIDDIYEPWKDWMLASPLNRKYPQAFISDGGNPLSAIINQGSYIFLQNDAGWRIRPPEEDITIYLTGNLAVADTTSPAFIPTIGAYTAAILGLQPVTQGVTEQMANQLDFVGDFTIGASDNVDSLILRGQGATHTTITFTAGCSTISTVIRNSEVIGDVEGALEIADCHVEPFVDVGSTITETVFKRCVLEPDVTNTIRLKAAGTKAIHINNCSSGSAGDTPVIMDVNGSSAPITIRQYAGGIQFSNITNAAQQISIDTTGGHITLDSTCTDIDEIVYRGDTKLTDNSSISAAKILDQSSSTLVWEHQIETTYTADEVMKLFASALAGKSSKSGNDRIYRDINDTKDRITATVTATGDRTAITTDVT